MVTERLVAGCAATVNGDKNNTREQPGAKDDQVSEGSGLQDEAWVSYSQVCGLDVCQQTAGVVRSDLQELAQSFYAIGTVGE